VEKFVEEECIPGDAVYAQQIGQGGTQARFSAHPKVLDDLKAKAKKLGLWNMFLPGNHGGAGYSNLEYGLMAEYLGKSLIASEVRFMSSYRPDDPLTSLRQRTAQHLTQVTWKYSRNTVPTHTRSSGSRHC